MPTPINIIDEDGEVADVQDRGLVVTMNPFPAVNENVIQVPLIRTVTVGGDGVTNNLIVDGSVDNIDAFVQAEDDGDIYLTTVNLIIEDNLTIFLDWFGGITAGLANGIVTFYEVEGVKTPISDVPILTNLDAISIGTLTKAFGEEEKAYRVKFDATSNTAYLPVWDLTRLSSGQGLLLRAGTKEKFGITIRDDLSPLVQFRMSAIGYKRLRGSN